MSRRRWIALVVLGVLVAAAAASGRYFFAPAPPGHGGFAFVRSVPGDRATIWAVGDGDASAGSRALVQRIAADHPDRLLYLGDVYERGTAGDFRGHYGPSFGRLARITAPTPGNHDWPRHPGGYDPYWQHALGRRRAAAWYAFRAGGWTILSIDSETDHGSGSPQLRWLRSRLRAPGTCRIAFWHRPRFSAGTHHGDDAGMAPLWDALRGHAAIVLSGHEHDMQRLHPIDGITSFVSGAGGHSHYALRRDDPRLAFGDDRADGALRLWLRRGSASYAFVTADGRVLDSGTLRCRPAATASSAWSSEGAQTGHVARGVFVARSVPARSRSDRAGTRRRRKAKHPVSASGHGCPDARHSSFDCRGHGCPDARHSSFAVGPGCPDARHSSFAVGPGCPDARHSSHRRHWSWAA